MGLDVYLKYSKDFDDAKAREEEYEERITELWNNICGKDTKYEDVSEEDKELYREQARLVAAELNLGEYGVATSVVDVNPPQNFNGYEPPEDHIFQIGYFRSSYNSAGINSQSRVHGFMSLYDIFPEAEGADEYHLKIDWEAALERAEAAIESIKEAGLKRPGNIFVVEVSSLRPDSEITDEASAIAAYREHYMRWGRNANNDMWSNSNYSNNEGYFAPKGMNVKALIVGTRSFLGQQIPATYAICEQPEEDDGDQFDYFAWAQEAYEMVKLTIEYVLAQDDPENYRLAWSA